MIQQSPQILRRLLLQKKRLSLTLVLSTSKTSKSSLSSEKEELRDVCTKDETAKGRKKRGAGENC